MMNFVEKGEDGIIRCVRKSFYPSRPSLAERLAKKIKRELGIECDPSTFRRTYVGRCQKQGGAFVWTMHAKDRHWTIGSCDTATQCVNSKYKLSILDDEIIADRIADK